MSGSGCTSRVRGECDGYPGSLCASFTGAGGGYGDGLGGIAGHGYVTDSPYKKVYKEVYISRDKVTIEESKYISMK